MDFDISSQRHGAVVVVAPAGEIDLWSAEPLREALVAAEADGAPALVVDLSQVGFIDSTGIGVLVGSLRRQREADRQLGLVVKPGPILKVLTITGMDGVFALFDDLGPALTQLGDGTAKAPEGEAPDA